MVAADFFAVAFRAELSVAADPGFLDRVAASDRSLCDVFACDERDRDDEADDDTAAVDFPSCEADR